MKAQVAARASSQISVSVHEGLDDAEPTHTDSSFFAGPLYSRKTWVWQDTPRRRTDDMADRISVPPGYKLVFRPWRTCPTTGQRIYAKMYGFRAWPILIPE